MRKILVIEDDAAICELLKVFLEEEGYQVVCLESALEALKLLNGKTFDLVTLDLHLPLMGGNEFLQRLEQSGPKIPVIVITADPDKLKRNTLVKSVVTKPFNLDYLSHAIQHQLER